MGGTFVWNYGIAMLNIGATIALTGLKFKGTQRKVVLAEQSHAPKSSIKSIKVTALSLLIIILWSFFSAWPLRLFSVTA
jgi:hypothetical protein